jgi:hypothetical protein
MHVFGFGLEGADLAADRTQARLVATTPCAGVLSHDAHELRLRSPPLLRVELPYKRSLS